MALKDRHILRWFEREVNGISANVVREVLRQRAQELLRDEQTLTAAIASQLNEKLLDRVRSELDQTTNRGVTVTVKVYSPRSEEPLVGADFGVATEVRDGAYRTTKGLLVQAKLEQDHDYKRLREQCERMLRITSDSFVLVYLGTEARIVSAHSVLGRGGNHREALKTSYSSTLGTLLGEMVRTFVGDHIVASMMRDVKALSAMKTEYGRPERAVLLTLSTQQG